MGHRPTRNYGRSVKIGVAAGAGLFVLGELGQVVLPRVQGPLPDWELTMFAWFSVGGIAIALLSVFVFGVALPLVE